jgi:hypothetical protein
MKSEAEEYLTVEQLAARLGWKPKTVQNKMNSIFKRGIHYAEAPGLPVMFRWSAVLALYEWKPEPALSPTLHTDDSIPMARGYSMK